MNRRKFVKGLLLTAASVPLMGHAKETYLLGTKVIYFPGKDNTGEVKYGPMSGYDIVSVMKVSGSTNGYNGTYQVIFAKDSQ